MENFDDLFTMQEEGNQELDAFDVEEYKARKQAERDDLYGLIDEATEGMQGNGELFQTYLDVQARFDRYSVNNAILIAAQRPEATGPLKTFDDWKAENIYVKRGAEAISILEPGTEYEREDGSTGVNYHVKKVFDLTQTQSRRRAAPAVTRDERLLLKALISNAPCKMAISEDMSERMNAIYKPDEKTIFVRQGMDGASIFRALSQELAHAHMDKGEYSRAETANAAYCVSYLLCQRYGVSTDAYSFGSMPEQYAKMEPQEFRRELGKIREVAGEISRSMSRVLEAQERSKKDRTEDAR